MAALRPQMKLRRSDVSNVAMVGGNEKRFTRIICDGRVQNWVGIGWVDEGPPSIAQQGRLPIVVDVIVSPRKRRKK